MTVAQIERALAKAGTAERRRVSAWYFPTRLRVFGTAVPEIRRIARGVKVEDPLALAKALVASKGFESRGVAYLILERSKAALDAKTVEQLGKGNDNWGCVDGFATLVAGPAWRRGQVSDATVRKWARSQDRWWRRTALVSTVALNLKSRGGTGDVPRTLMICELLVADHDDMVVKAMSWALRELSRREPAIVRRFLEQHREQLHPRVLREVRRKLETGRK